VPFIVGENVGPYRITRQLGVGGMATVWKAYHAALDRYVAIKVLHPSFKEDPQFTARFQREARIVAKLIHPHIVPIYDFSEHEGMSYLVMRYIDGRTLKAVLKEGPLSLDEMMDILEPAGRALAYAHEQGVLHRDIKPSNFILSSEGDVFLTDFGLARMAETTDSTLSRDMLVGTPQYISPEQARGETLDARTDIYSLGVVLFEMLTGKVPYDADTPYAVIHDHIFSPLPLPTQFKADIPEVVERVVLKALAKDRNDRFENVREMVSALEESLAGEAVTIKAQQALLEDTEQSIEESAEGVIPIAGAAEEPPPVEETGEVEAPARPRGRSRRLIAIIAVLGILLGVCICGSVLVLALRGAGDQDQPLIEAAQTPGATVEPVREDPAAHVYLARRYLQQGNVQEAIAEYEVAIDLDPEYVEAYIDLGNIMARENDLERALELFQEALDIDPDHVKAHLGMGDAYLLQMEFDAAALHYQIVVDQDPQVAGPHAKLGICHVRVSDVEFGRSECELALRLDSKLPEGHFCMGVYFAQRGDLDQARREFEIVVESGSDRLADQARRQLDRLE
jgi:tetratricopeptide (TPR) repeat protein/predicted Ser/Thr protein kinase